MAIFKRKKKQGSVESFKFVNEIYLPLTSFGNNISKSDVVKIAIDRIASQSAKLKPRYIKKANDKTVTEKWYDTSKVDTGNNIKKYLFNAVF